MAVFPVVRCDSPPWRWRHQRPLKRWWASTSLHSATTQKTANVSCWTWHGDVKIRVTFVLRSGTNICCGWPRLQLAHRKRTLPCTASAAPRGPTGHSPATCHPWCGNRRIAWSAIQMTNPKAFIHIQKLHAANFPSPTLSASPAPRQNPFQFQLPFEYLMQEQHRAAGYLCKRSFIWDRRRADTTNSTLERATHWQLSPFCH
jgi:hypothetical protein